MTNPVQIPRRAFHFYRRGRRTFNGVTLARGLLLLALAIVIWVLTLLALGVPGEWLQFLEAHAPESPFAVEARTASFDLVRGLVLRHVRVYVKGWPGPPFAEVSRAQVRINPGAFVTGGKRVESILLSGGAIREAPGAGDGTVPDDWGVWSCRLELRDFEVFGQPVVQADAEVEAAGRRLAVRRVDGEIAGPDGARGRIQGECETHGESRRFHGAFRWQGDPLASNPLFDFLHAPGVNTVFRGFRHGPRPPAGEAEFEGGYGPDWHFRFLTTASGRDGRFFGYGYKQMYMRIRFEAGAQQDAVLSFEPLVWMGDHGMAAGEFSANFSDNELRFDGYATGEPAAWFEAQGGARDWWPAAIRLVGPTRVQAAGVWNWRDRGRNAAAIFFGAEQLTAGGMAVDRLTWNARVSGTAFEIRDIKADCFGGSFTGAVDAAAVWAPTGGLARVPFSVQGGVQGVDLRLLRGEEQFAGVVRQLGELSGVIQINGVSGPDWRDALRGAGSVRIRDGRLFRVPLFGPLTDWLSRLIPGLDMLMSQTDATADWRVEDGQAKFEKIWVDGDLLSLSGHGSYALTNHLDFDIQVKLMKADSLMGMALRAITLPVSKLFEFRLRGPTENPRWYPMNFSSDILEKIPFTGRGERDAGGDRNSAPESGASP